MGITGLIPLLKKATKNCNVRKFSGCTVAIDAYSWLHKGAFGCAEKLGKGEPTTAYISYCLKYIQILLNNNVKPILVLDGRNLPSKAITEKKRREKRDENRRLARKYLQEGKKKEAWECFTRCVDVTPAMAREFIKVLRSMKIDYVVAPYEADAQLAYLATNGIADIIITEDSDLVLFGCPKIFFKMNMNGDGVLFDSSKLPMCFGLTASNFNFEHFRWMCILSGCDYLQSLPGIGLGRAKKVVLATNHESIETMIRSVPSILDKVSVEITDEYIDAFIQADDTFLYQLVFDTIKRQLLPLKPYPENLDPDDLPYAGAYVNQNLATEMALGNVDIHTLKVVDHFDPLKNGYTITSIWAPTFTPGKYTGFQSLGIKTETTQIAMELSTVKKSSPKKKRPFAVTSLANEDTTPDDAELMSIYGGEDKSDVKLFTDKCESSKDLVGVKSQNESTSSPSSSKRRRVEEQRNEDHFSSPSSNTRSQNRNVLFRKSAEKINYNVRSKYFKSEKDETVECSNKLKPVVQKTEINSPESSDVEDDIVEISSSNCSSETKLSIYSSSQGSECSKKSDSSQSDSNKSQETPFSDYEIEKNAVKVNLSQEILLNPTVRLEKITFEDDDEAYGSAQSGCSSYSLRSTPSPSTLTSTSSRSSPYFSESVSTAKIKTTRSTMKTITPSPCRRIGLSRTTLSTKKDPKQPSIKDMFRKNL